jgi:transposase
LQDVVAPDCRIERKWDNVGCLLGWRVEEGQERVTDAAALRTLVMRVVSESYDMEKQSGRVRRSQAERIGNCAR